jgi:PASTA domain
MDVDQYAAARFGRLIEHAVRLGCPEEEAGALVDRVLVEQRKRIRRAEDPDPLVHDALDRALHGPARGDRTGLVVGGGLLGLVGATAVVALALGPGTPPEPMPSLFGLDGDQAEHVLRDQGYEVVLRPASSCEPPGLVVGSDPPGGGDVEDGDTITVRTSVLVGSQCEADYPARAAAWEFLRFALGRGPAPEFARTVTVVVNGQDPYHLDRVAAVDPDRWGGLFDRVGRTARTVSPTDSGMPSLRVTEDLLPAALCGVPKPAGTGDRRVLRIEVDAHPADGRSCPLTIDLYRSSDHTIDGVVVYTAKTTDHGHDLVRAK